ncbi:hypothetical protein EDS67_21920 [candidate division KSB1 bacterium]|nr:MAG: hypothetical protein EDS67_21920 [candidate division KSB1 bacterium]MBC6949777.1 hypothetical protein [candidate division KSB1 bacterium]
MPCAGAPLGRHRQVPVLKFANTVHGMRQYVKANDKTQVKFSRGRAHWLADSRKADSKTKSNPF